MNQVNPEPLHPSGESVESPVSQGQEDTCLAAAVAKARGAVSPNNIEAGVRFLNQQSQTINERLIQVCRLHGYIYCATCTEFTER